MKLNRKETQYTIEAINDRLNYIRQRKEVNNDEQESLNSSISKLRSYLLDLVAIKQVIADYFFMHKDNVIQHCDDDEEFHITINTKTLRIEFILEDSETFKYADLYQYNKIFSNGKAYYWRWL